MINAVIFDMDGLMYDTEPLVEKSWKLAARHTKLTMTPQTLAALRCRNSADREIFLKSIFGDRIDYRRLEHQMYRELYPIINDKGLPQKPGLWELLVYLKQNNYRIAMQTTSTFDTAKWYLELSGCAEFFDVVIAGRAAVHSKPEPDIYLRAVAQLGMKPEECLVLEDSPLGIIGAHRAGCPSVMIPDLDEPTQAVYALGADVLNNLAEVIGYLRRNSGHTEKSNVKIRNVVFDIGGVLMDMDAAAYLRKRFSDKELEHMLYQISFGSELWLDLESGQITQEEAERRMLEQARDMHCRFEMRMVLDEWEEAIKPKMDTISLLRRLKKRGCHLYFLSNLTPKLYEKLKQQDFMKLFDGGIVSCEAHLRKPSTVIYEMLSGEYGLNPKETIYFDDSKENIETACSLGYVGRRFHSAMLAEKNLEGYQVL